MDLLGTASNLLAMASNLIAMASNLIAMCVYIYMCVYVYIYMLLIYIPMVLTNILDNSSGGPASHLIFKKLVGQTDGGHHISHELSI